MRALTLIVVLASLAACGKKPEVPKPGEPQSRAETQSLRSSSATLGYPGDAIADKVDGVLDANDQRKGHLDAAIDAQSNTQ